MTQIDSAPALTATPSTQAKMSFRVDFGRRSTTISEVEVPFQGRTPRVSRLMALAIKFDGLIHSGRVRDYAHLSRLGRVTRARMTQIMSLLNLDPKIQEELLFLGTVEKGRDPFILRDLLPVTMEPVFAKQRKMWGNLKSR